MAFRKEIKFRVKLAEYHKLKEYLKSEGMQEQYPQRQINSIYFDNSHLAMFYDSEEGIMPRKKVRIRWYKNDHQYTLETKVSSTEGRFKKTKKIENSNAKDNLLSTGIIDTQYGIIHPVLLVSYTRSYHNYQSVRLTFDQNIKYQSLKKITPHYFYDPENVIEIKTRIECPDDFLHKILKLSNTRFSKYCRGIIFSNIYR